MPNPVVNRRALIARSGFTYDSEVLDWITRVEGFGSSVPQATKDAANTFMVTIKALGLRSKILRMGVYAGATKAACQAPFIRDVGAAADTFTAAITAATWIYSETGAGGGLKSTGSDILNTGVAADNASMGLENYHIGVYKTTKNANISMGAGTTGVGVVYFFFDTAADKAYYTMFSSTNDIPLIADAGQIGHYVASRNGTLTAFKNGSSVGSNATPAGARPSGEILVHNASLNGNPWPSSATQSVMACYHLGTFLTSGEVASLYTPIQAFQTALTRNV